MKQRRVVVTGIGTLNPLGNSPEEYFDNLEKGVSGVGPITRFDASKFKTRFAAEVKGYNPLDHFDRKEVKKYDLFAQFALVAADQAVKDSGLDLEKAKQAVSIIELIANDPEIGAIYSGRVTRLMSFGAFVEIAPGKEGLVHISKLDVKRVEKVEDVVAVGDQVIVKVTEIDDQGRINLSRRDALVEINGAVVEDNGEEENTNRKGGKRRGFKKHD